METTSDHLDHQVLLKNDCERICVGYKPDGVLGSQLNHQLHSEHGKDIRIKIADITSFYPSGKPLDMCFSEKILPMCAVVRPTLILVSDFVQKCVCGDTKTSILGLGRYGRYIENFAISNSIFDIEVISLSPIFAP